MTTKYFEFTVIHHRKTIKANCYTYTREGESEMPYKYPLYRVALETKPVNPPVYLFWETDNPKEKFFAYSLPKADVAKNEMMSSILAALNKLNIKSISVDLKVR